MHINGGLVVNLGNTCARKVKEVEQRRKFGTCSSCVVVGTTGLFDLLYSGVTGLWQTCEHRRRLRGCEAEAGRAHLVSVRA